MTKVHHKQAFERCEESKKNTILDVGISEFSEHGFDKANINVIAKKAGVSVGLMYKYFETKEDFFITCVDKAFEMLENTINEVIENDDSILKKAERLIREIQKSSNENSNYVKLYNETTKAGSSKLIRELAFRIEGVSARAYSAFIKKAMKDETIRNDCDPLMFAFFFDSLLMTLQFSYTCDYYRERFKTYCGEDVFSSDEKVVKELLKFLESAFTFNHDDIKKLNK